VTTGKNNSNQHAPTQNSAAKEFPIVGIGASAGGLEAFKVLLESLSTKTGLAFVVIQHLATGQESMLTDILSRFTSMPVHQVEDGMQVKPDNVYVIPPGSTMTLSKNSLKLSPKGKSLRPIDAFLNSLALERKTQAIGIVLSGTGTDGTEGLKAVKAEGGITFAQEPESAQYAGMPQSAISAESVDFILSPSKIAKELSKIAQNPQLVRAVISAQEPQTRKETGLRKIFTLLKSSSNVDFTHYKETVVNRRITRRIVINHLDNITKYAEFLGTNPYELQALFNDMLIGVTSFFREPETFKVLKEKLLPELLKKRGSTEPLRIWIPGCSTGEEAYSFAIAIQEFLEENNNADIQVQIFGTDVNEKNIDKARQGIYPKSIEADVAESRLKRFFTSFNGSYQISKFIRDKCVFAKQDLIADPPFSNLDLISCRNMLIYFDWQLQERIVPILHYALKPNGFLVLGESESIGKFTMLFVAVEKKNFIYTKRSAQPQVSFGFAASVPYTAKTMAKEPVKKDTIALLGEQVDRLLITDYVPAAMLVNSNLDILVFRGNVTPYISPESGQTSLNVTKILRKELRAEIQTVVYRAKKDNKPVAEGAIRFQDGELQKTVNIQAIPLDSLQRDEPFFLVLIEDVSSAAAHLQETIELTATPEGLDNVKDSQIRELKDDLDSSKRTLLTIVENQEATNEELRSTLEELQSSNEELQSTNEELETAKEELQSSNEELTTLNDELKNRNQALGVLSDNQTNLIKNVDPAVVMVDNRLRIRLFTPSAQKLLNLIPSDTGLPISNIRIGISVPELDKSILEVIKTLSPLNSEVTDEKGRFYEMRIRPYVTEDNRIDGAVLSFIDINELREHENKLQIEETKYRTLAENSPDIIARFDRKQRYLYVNSIVEKIMGISAKNFIGKTDAEIGLPQKLAETWGKVLQTVIETGKSEKGELEFPTLDGTRIHQYVVVPEFSVNGAVETVLALMKDVTDPKRTMESARKNLERYRSFVEVSGELGWITNADGEVIEDIPSWRKFTGQTFEEVFGWGWSKALHPEDVEHAIKVWEEAVRTKNVYEVEYRVRKHDGVYRLFEVRGVPMFRDDGSVLEWIGTCIDITERNKVEEALRKQAALIDLSPDAILVKDKDDRITFWSEGAEKLYGWKKNEAVGQKTCDLLKPQFPESLKRINTKLRRTGRWSGEVIHIAKNGQIVMVQSWWLAKNNEFGRMVEILESNVDITERKIAELKVEFEAERLRTVMETSIDLTMLTKPDGKILYVNSAVKRIAGYEKAEFVDQSPWIVHPDESDKAREVFGLVLKGETVEFEHRIITKDGQTKWVIHSSSPVKRAGKVVEIVSTVRDITRRKKMELALSASLKETKQMESEVSALLKASRAVLEKKEFQDSARAIFDTCKELIGATAGYVALLNSTGSENEVLFLDSGGLPCTVDPSLPMPIRGLRAEVYNSGNAEFENDFPSSEWQKFFPKGHVRLKNVLFAPLTIDQRVVGVIGLANKEGGFTERDAHMATAFGEIASVALANSQILEKLEKNEKELKRYAEHLEALVEERTQKLRGAERLAAIGTIAGTVGHDIRNPLQAISGNVFLAKTDLVSFPEGEEKTNVQKSLEEIETNANYINKIVEDLQEFAKPLTPKIEEIHLRKIVNSALTTLKIPENITTTLCFKDDFPKIKADPTYLQRILVNLSNNAIQAMPNGGRLTISAGTNNRRVTITVQDTGEGIPEDVKSKIFTPLITTKAKGQGFGLAAVKRFSEAMGGTVTFESEAGKGTKFTIELPSQC
jgi:PAS domain S-box-containing protein